MFEFFLEQLAALITFFAFPAIQYVILKFFSRREGRPELWFLPKYGFRLVVHNISGKRVISDLRYKAILRRVVPAGDGSSVATFQDIVLHDREDMFCFQGTDQVLLCFRVERTNTDQRYLVHTDKLGAELARHELLNGDRLVVDYTANVANFFNFDIRLAKRAELHSPTLMALDSPGEEEREIVLDRIRNVG
ncbi:MAG: hypothetical protein AB7P24_03850 [Nitrospira sp.]